MGSITNTVTVDPNNAIFEADETNNTTTQSTTVSTGVDLVVWKGDDGASGEDPPGGAPALTEGYDPIATNGTDTYTIVVDNVGTQDVVGIKVRDTLPAGTEFLSVTADHGFTCSHDGSATGGNVTCVGGSLKGTQSEFYDPPGVAGAGPGDDFAIIKIKVFVTPFVQPVMHNEVRVDPDSEIAEANELNNFAFDDTTVTVGDDDLGAFNQLKIDKTQTSPASGLPVATNGTLIYTLDVDNAGTDPVSNVVVKDFLPTGSRFIEATDTATGSAAFFCTHNGAALGGVVTCTGGDFSGSVNTIPPAVPTSRAITVKVFAPNTPGTYANLATVDPDDVVAEGNEFDNDAQVSTTVTVGGNNMFNELNLTKTQTTPVGDAGTSSVVEYELVSDQRRQRSGVPGRRARHAARRLLLHLRRRRARRRQRVPVQQRGERGHVHLGPDRRRPARPGRSASRRSRRRSRARTRTRQSSIRTTPSRRATRPTTRPRRTRRSSWVWASPTLGCPRPGRRASSRVRRSRTT